MTIALERPLLDRIQAFVRQARLASTTHSALEIAPETASLLADYLAEALAATEDQAWFWTSGWQRGEREAEADLAAGRYETFDTMEDLLSG